VGSSEEEVRRGIPRKIQNYSIILKNHSIIMNNHSIHIMRNYSSEKVEHSIPAFGICGIHILAKSG
jgi:hypothetical protein